MYEISVKVGKLTAIFCFKLERMKGLCSCWVVHSFGMWDDCDEGDGPISVGKEFRALPKNRQQTILRQIGEKIEHKAGYENEERNMLLASDAVDGGWVEFAMDVETPRGLRLSDICVACGWDVIQEYKSAATENRIRIYSIVLDS